MELRTALNPQEFPRIAKEMGFTFSLRRGRVDWHRIGNINVDQLVQERDLITLQDNLMNIIHYNLDSEYDVKVLDHTFVKLFKLAQLSVDYLMYSEQHLYNCIELIHRQLSTSAKENEKLRKECRKRDEELKNFKRKLKEREKLKSTDAHLCRCTHHPQARSDDNYFKCSHCSKAFMNPTFLEAHHTRRHLSLPFLQPRHKQMEVEHLQSEVKRLRELIEQQEKEDKENIPENTQSRQPDDKKDEKKEWEEEYKRKMEEWESKYKEEISAIKNLFDVEVKNLQSIKEATVESATSTPSREMMEQLDLRDREIQRLSTQASQLEAQDVVWKSRFTALEAQYMAAIGELRQQLAATQQDGKLLLQSKSDYEVHIQELLTKVTSQDELIHAQGEQIHELSELKTRVWAQSLEQELALRRRAPPARSQEDAMTSPVRTPSVYVSAQPVTETVPASRQHSPASSNRSASPEKVITGPVPTKCVPSEVAVVSPEKTPVFFISSKKTGTASKSQIHEDVPPSPIRIPVQVPPPTSPAQVPIPPPSEPWKRLSFSRTTVTPIQPEPETELSSESSTCSSSSSERGIVKTGSSTAPAVHPVCDEPDHASVESSSEEEDSEGSEEQSDVAATPEKVPPLRTIDSMENALAQNPHIMEELKQDLKDILHRRLRELGVDPEWDGIPTSTYAHKMDTLQHHQNITAKRLKSYFHNHQLLLNEVERRLSGGKGVVSHPAPVVPDVPGRTALDRLVSSVRQKAAGVFSGRKLGTSSSSFVEKSHSSSAVHVPKSQKDHRTDIINPKTYRHDKNRTKRSKLTKTQSNVSEHHVDRTADPNRKTRISRVHKDSISDPGHRKGALGMHVESVPGTRKSSRLLEIQTEMVVEPKRSRSEVHTGSVVGIKRSDKRTGAHVDSDTQRQRTTPDGQETRFKLPSKTPISAFTATSVSKTKEDRVFSNADFETSRPSEVKMVTSTPNKNTAISILKRGVIESETESAKTEETTPKESSSSSSSNEDDNERAPRVMEAPRQRLRGVGGFTEVVLATKSNLKSASSTSSLTKKKVLFAEQETQEKDASSVILGPTRGFSEESVGQRSSLDSASNKTVTFANSTNSKVSQLSKERPESESEWSEISNTEASSPQTPPTSDGSRQIQLSTRQSEKIAQISKNIEHQLSLTRMKPTGGVEAMFYKGVTTPVSPVSSTNVLSPFGSSGSLQDVGQAKKTENLPVPKPRLQQPSAQHAPVTHLTPSEWDLEDFDD